MTNEEAIYTLERLAHTEAKWPGTEETLEALDMAVSALRTAPTLIGRGIWVNASKRMPEDGQIVLVTVSGKPQSNITLEYAYELAEWSIEEGWILNRWPEWAGGKVTHWLPLPEPPVEEVKE